MNWEQWLRSAAARPSNNEETNRDRTERQIVDALNDYPALAGRPWRVYVKGSYANNTNVRLNFDVDIAVEYYGYFYFDMALELKGHDQSEVGVVDTTDTYSREEFKADIRGALEKAFGKSAIKPGRIAYRVREQKTTLPADVVPSWEYRRYDRLDRYGQPVVYRGSRVYPSDGGFKNNFPKIQVERGTAKNNRTGRRYKRMVRCLKKLQTMLVSEAILDEELPSYLTECLVYNVTDAAFNQETYLADFKSVLAQIFNATLRDGGADEWEEVHGLHYLFRGTNSWTIPQVHSVIDKCWDYVFE
jgi:hypothetical protein